MPETIILELVFQASLGTSSKNSTDASSPIWKKAGDYLVSKTNPRGAIMKSNGWMERILTAMPYLLTDRLLFGSHRAAQPLQILVQRMIGGPRPASFLLDGHTFHCQTGHKYFFERQDFERDVWQMLRDRIRPDDVVYDVGAHFGFWAIRLSRVCRHVIAFEPSPTNLVTLIQNVGTIPNVTIVNAALGSAEGVMSFFEGGTMSRVGVGDVKVDVTTLDLSAEQHPEPTFVLVDVEGFGTEVLRGGRRVLIRHLPVMCEIHDANERDGVFELLRNAEYTIRLLDADRHFPFRIFATAPE
jgi:FkbM family methyltransferase